MTFASISPWNVGQRLRVFGYHYKDRGGNDAIDYGGGNEMVLVVARVQLNGIVCDLLQPNGDGTWRNHGHRMLYKWEEQWETIEKL